MSDFDSRELEVARARSRARRPCWCAATTARKLQIDSKAGDEPVTEADHAANALIVARLREAFPDDVVLSEEIPDDGARLGSRASGWSIRSTARATSSWATPGSWS